jgi:hypothetical protein
MGVHIQEVIGTVQRTPDRGPAHPPPGSRGRHVEPQPLPEEAIRAFLVREAQLVQRVQAD